MAATILNTEVAINVSVQVVRAFLRLREMALTNRELIHKINSMEKKYDYQFKAVFDAIRQLMAPPEKKRRLIGFGRE